MNITSVDGQDYAGRKTRRGQMKNRLGGIIDFTDTIHQGHPAKRIDIGISVKRRSNDAGGDGIDLDVVSRKLSRQAGGQGVHAAFGDQRGACGQTGHRMHDQHGADIDDTAAALFLHLPHNGLGNEVSSFRRFRRC